MRGMRAGIWAIAVLAVGLTACTKEKMAEQAEPAAEPAKEMMPVASLHDRLGGTDAIRAVVDKFVDRAAFDERITNKVVNNRMAQIDIDKLKGHIGDQMCEATGGPCKYAGRDMKAVHTGLNITNADFDYVVDDLAVTLDEFKVPEPERSEVLAILAPLRADVVQGEEPRMEAEGEAEGETEEAAPAPADT